MLRDILLLLVLLGPKVAHGFRYDEAEKTLKAIREKPNLLDEGGNSTMLLSDCNYQRGDLKRIVVSATRAMDFFEKHLDEMVIDAAIGTRIMESQLMLFQAGHPKLPQTLQMYLMTLQFKSELLSEEIIDKFTDLMMTNQLAQQERSKLVQNLYWVYNASLWESPSLGNWKLKNEAETPTVNNTMENMEAQVEVMKEEISDQCISGIFQGCSVTDGCAKLFMEKPHSKYSLTHQVLFFLIAKKQKCFTDERFKSKTGNYTDPAEFVRTMCDRVWEEANAIEESGFPSQYRDLLAEQITVCSLAGYTQFLKRSWLENILSWQNQDDSVGCFMATRVPEPSPELNEEVVKVVPNVKTSRRVKRSDNFVRVGDINNCSVHFTSVSLGAMAMHLRYFGDTCLKNY